jgi:hypothetical protein
MNRRALYAALGLLIAVNAVVLLGVVRNRSGEPDAVLTLTEREMPLSWPFRHEENTGVSLHLNLNSDIEAQRWFDEAKLAELGFDTGHFRESDNWRVYRELPRKAFVVLEYDGEAWERHRQRQLQEIENLVVKVREGKLKPEEAENQKAFSPVDRIPPVQRRCRVRRRDSAPALCRSKPLSHPAGQGAHDGRPGAGFGG